MSQVAPQGMHPTSLPFPALYSCSVISSPTRHSFDGDRALSNGRGRPPAPLPHPQRTDQCSSRSVYGQSRCLLFPLPTGRQMAISLGIWWTTRSPEGYTASSLPAQRWWPQSTLRCLYGVHFLDLLGDGHCPSTRRVVVALRSTRVAG